MAPSDTTLYSVSRDSVPKKAILSPLILLEPIKSDSAEERDGNVFEEMPMRKTGRFRFLSNGRNGEGKDKGGG